LTISVRWLTFFVSRKLKLARAQAFVQLILMSGPALSELMRLSARQRLAIAERLWLSVADEQKLPVADEHKRVLRRRLADYRAGRSKVIKHEDLIRRLQSS
jgi:putative addiction module component (TIGR02574 family)